VKDKDFSLDSVEMISDFGRATITMEQLNKYMDSFVKKFPPITETQTRITPIIMPKMNFKSRKTS